MAQMANMHIAGSGTYTPTKSTATFTIDTHATGWRHFLICAKEIPFDEAIARRLGSRYVDLDNDYIICVYSRSNPSATQLSPDSVTAVKLSTMSNNSITITDSVITWTGIQAYAGLLIENKEYLWWCW